MTRALAAIGVATAAFGIVAAISLITSSVDPGSGGDRRLVHSTEQAGATAGISSNWAGYVATGLGSTATTAAMSMAYSDVTGQWVQPAAKCVPGQTSSAALWVGLGGYSIESDKLEQTGTSADCDATTGKATYYAWYELVPADSVNVSLKIGPGDVIAASVVVIGPNRILVQVKDRTRGTAFTKRLTMTEPDQTSAEWVVEAPAACSSNGFCRQVPLANFGTIDFSRTFANGNSVPATITSPTWMTTQLQLIPEPHRFFGDPNERLAQSSGAGAAPGDLTTNGGGFTVSWQASPVAPA